MTRHSWLLVAVLATAVLGGCDGPSTPTPPPPPPPSGGGPNTPPANSAPVITRVVANATRTEVNRDVELSVEITDAETSVDALTYQWSATVGTITSAGRHGLWRLAKGSAATPTDVTIKVVVTEPYQVLENNVLVTREHRVEATAAPFRVHDSDGEVGDLVNEFLHDFANNAVSPSACVKNFSDSCAGKSAEMIDIQNVRTNYVVLNSTISLTSITFNGAMTTSDAVAFCRFQSQVKSTGKTETATGDCLLTAIYENGFWKLCSSNFFGQTTEPENRFFGRPQRIKR